MEEKNLLKWYWGNSHPIWKKVKLDSYTRINFRYTKDLNVKHEIIQVVEENMGEYLYNLVWGKLSDYDSNPDMKKYIDKHI